MKSQEKITIKPVNSKGEQAVYLYIPDAKYKKQRYIGYIKNRTFFTSRWKSNQTFNKAAAIGINYKLLNEGGKYFDYIVISYDDKLLKASRVFFLNRGYFLHFKSNGLDKQKFLEISGFSAAEKENQNEIERIEKLNKEYKYFGEVLKTRALELQAGLF